MSANPNDFTYWIRDGAIILPGTEGKVAGTGDFEYWMRNGTLLFPVAIPPSGSTSASCNAGVANVTISAKPAAANVKPNAGRANGTWTADAQVVIGEIANAGNAGVTVHAYNPSASVKTHAALANGTWAAYNAVAKTAVNAVAGAASVIVVAYGVHPTITTHAGVANAAITGNDTAASIKTHASSAAVVATSNTAEANVQPHAGRSAASVAAYGSKPGVAPTAGLATGPWTTYGASVAITGSASVHAGLAAVNIVALSGTVSIPAPAMTSRGAGGGGGPPTIVYRKPKSHQLDDHEPKVPRPVPLSLSAQYDALLEAGEITEDEWIGLYMIHGVMPARAGAQ